MNNFTIITNERAFKCLSIKLRDDGLLFETPYEKQLCLYRIELPDIEAFYDRDALNDEEMLAYDFYLDFYHHSNYYVDTKLLTAFVFKHFIIPLIQDKKDVFDLSYFEREIMHLFMRNKEFRKEFKLLLKKTEVFQKQQSKSQKQEDSIMNKDGSLNYEKLVQKILNITSKNRD